MPAKKDKARRNQQSLNDPGQHGPSSHSPFPFPLSPFLQVVEPGLSTRVVDFGRPGSRSLGVPLGGAADRYSLAIGNALVGNSPDAAALEITLAGPILHAGCDLGCVVYGAPFDLSLSGRKARAGTTFTLFAGEDLHILGTTEGMRAYFCVRGGLQSKEVLGSRSSLNPLEAGEELACCSGRTPARFVRLPSSRQPSQEALRVLDGPQAEWFRTEEFYSGEFTVTPASNRMGLRLSGKAVEGPAPELVSEPVCPGSVQVVRDGQCIILGVDGQTIGGYPKIAQVISADLDKLGQLRPGQQVSFTRVSLDEAEIFYRYRQAELHQWTTRLRSTMNVTGASSLVI